LNPACVQKLGLINFFLTFIFITLSCEKNRIHIA
jgi:hypothetical protein